MGLSSSSSSTESATHNPVWQMFHGDGAVWNKMANAQHPQTSPQPMPQAPSFQPQPTQPQGQPQTISDGQPVQPVMPQQSTMQPQNMQQQWRPPYAGSGGLMQMGSQPFSLQSWMMNNR